MMTNRDRFLKLLEKYINNRISPKEHDELFADINGGAYDDLLSDYILNTFNAEDTVLSQLNKTKSEDIQSNILKHRGVDDAPLKSIKKFIPLLVAASILLIISFSLYFFSKNSTPAGEQFVGRITNPTHTVGNFTQSTKTVKLGDGTSVTLFPGAEISYPSKFASDKREVNLKGKAFFKVSKSLSRHFYVYHDNLTTHVLGTSFTIAASASKKTITVSVATGRVEVYERAKASSDNKAGKNGVVIYPNQKVQYNAVSRRFSVGLVERPMPVVSENQIQNISFDFSENTLNEVLTAIEKVYQVSFLVGDPSILNCNFTGDLSKQDLYTKLDVVCQSVGAAYKLDGTKIIITGKGCTN